MTQLRKEAAERDLDNLNAQLQRKKGKLDEMEELMKRRVKELQELQSLGLTKEDVWILLIIIFVNYSSLFWVKGEGILYCSF